MFSDRDIKCVVNLRKSVLQNVVEPNQYRQLQAPKLQALDQLLQVNADRRVPTRMDDQVAVFTDGEIPFPPATDFVQLFGFGRRPAANVLF